MVNGYLGGPLLRSYEFKVFKEPTRKVEWPAFLLEQNYFVASPARLKRWFGEEWVEHVLLRARNDMARTMDKGAFSTKLISWSDLYFAQARYYSNNFLQHLHLAEAILPLYSHDLIAFKLEHHPSVLSRDTCVNIFRAHFPNLATIPHAHDLEIANAARRDASFLSRLTHFPRVSRYTAKWARQLLPIMMDQKCFYGLRKKAPILYTLTSTSSLLQRSSRRFAESAQAAVFNFQRFYLLEERCRDAGLELDWRSV